MKEIKFRYWDMIHKNFITDCEVYFVAEDYILAGDVGNPPLIDVSGHVQVSQYTGLKDKNGKEIYEGYILEAEHKLNTQKFMRKYQVIFNERGYWDAISLDDKPVRLCYAGFDKCKVIGNIYENPELLEGAK